MQRRRQGSTHHYVPLEFRAQLFNCSCGGSSVLSAPIALYIAKKYLDMLKACVMHRNGTGNTGKEHWRKASSFNFSDISDINRRMMLVS